MNAYHIDILEPDPVYGLRSKEALKKCLREGAVVACDVVWAEVATVYGQNPEKWVEAMRTVRIEFSATKLESAIKAARAWHQFRNQGGGRDRIAADFLIGGHATVQADRLLTRDNGFFRLHFNGLKVTAP